MRFLATAFGLGALVFFAFRIISFLCLVDNYLMRNVIGTDMLGGGEKRAPDDRGGTESGV